MQAQIDALEQALAQTQEALAGTQKNSSTSSTKPPSSDIVKPPKPRSKKGCNRRQGGQPGHANYERTFRLEEADVVHAHTLDRYPRCADQSLIRCVEDDPFQARDRIRGMRKNKQVIDISGCVH